MLIHLPEVVVSPPSIYLLLARELLKPSIAVAAQNISDKAPGAYTGEIAVSQVKDAGAAWVILGHSERRQMYHESNEVRFPQINPLTKTMNNADYKVDCC
jgi:triosephosphate isomerase